MKNLLSKFLKKDLMSSFVSIFATRKLTPNHLRTMFEFEIGGNEIKPYASEAIIEIPHNRTLLAQKLTDNDPLQPELVYGLKTVEEVFAHFKPNVNVEFETEEGVLVRENLKFSQLGGFALKNMTQQSPFLRTLNAQQQEYLMISRQLKSNKILRAVLEKDEAKNSLISSLQSLIQELEENDYKD